jgi:hypothetical protein
MRCDKLGQLHDEAQAGGLDNVKLAESARKGDAEAQFNIGSIYNDPAGCREELLEAV